MFGLSHLVSSLPMPALRRRLRAADVALLDMDGSLHWGITQGVAAARLFWQIARRPERPGDRHFLAPLASGGLSVCAQHLLPPPADLEKRNRRMIDLWCRAFRGVPMTYFHRAVVHIPGQSFPGVRRTIERLAGRMQVGIISVGLDIVVQEYIRQFTRRGEPLITFYRCNRMVTEGQEGREVFAGRYVEPMIVSARDKAAAGEAFIHAPGVRHPLVVGNDEADAALARMAQERGGLAIGIRPPKPLRRVFDAYLTRADWSPLAELLG